MADNILLNSGSGGETLATDDIAGKHYQIIKLTLGALDAQTLASSGNGTVNAGVQRVTLASDSTGLVKLAAGTAEIGKLAAGVAEIGNVKNAGTFGVQIVDTSFAVADGNALGEGVLVQGDDGADRKNINVDASTGDVQVDITHTVTVDGSGVTQPISGEVSIGAATTDAGDLAKAEDAVHASGDVGVMALAVRNDTLAALAADGDYAPLQVDDLGGLFTREAPSIIDAGNSTTTAINAAAVFTGTGKDVTGCSGVSVILDSSHDSATDGMTFQWSSDNTNWDYVHTHTYTAADGGRTFQFGVQAQYFRVVYTNGGINQTAFRVQTILQRTSVSTTIHRLVDNTSPDRSAALIKSAIIAQAAGSGDFVPIAATAAGNLKMSLQEISDGLDIGAGDAGSETLRVSISTNDVNMVAIKTAVELSDNAISGAGYNITQLNGVNVTMGNGVDGTGVQRVTLASDSTGLVKLAAGTAGIGKLTANDGVDIGDVDVTSISAGANLIGDVGIGVRTSGGTTIFRSIDLDEGTLEVIKGSAGQIYWLHIINLATSVRFVKIYNATSGTIGTGTPVLTFPIPTQGDSNGAGFVLVVPNGIAFGTGISIGASTAIADNDTGAPGANEVIANIGFA